jgi:Domain of unknown function (DUF4398)
MTRMTRRGANPYRLSAALAALGGTLLLAACASTPPAPLASLAEARQAIAVADQAHITDASAPELAEARSRLTAADAAVQARHMAAADRLAQESRVDAELSLANSNASKNQTVNDEMLRSTEVLSTEMQRNAGAKP